MIGKLLFAAAGLMAGIYLTIHYPAQSQILYNHTLSLFRELAGRYKL